MKNIKRLIALLLVATMMTTVCACGGGKNNGDEGGFQRDKNTLNVLVFDGGYGTEYIERLAEAFEAEYPGINVVVEPTKIPLENRQQVEADRYVADVIITDTNYTTLGVKGKLLDITDVYNSYAFGESNITIKDKLAEAAEVNEFDGKYYQLPVYAGATGILYNKVYLDAIYGEGGYELPVTSQQLVDMCSDIKNKNAWPFVYTNSTDAEYLVWLRDIWVAQYMGYEEYKNYYNLQYTDANGNLTTATTAAELSASIRTARESALLPLATIMSNKLGYVPESCSSMSFSQAQAYFVGYTAQTDVKVVDGHKGAAFMVNGDWLWSEIEKYSSMVEVDVRFMRTPVNSGLIDKLATVNTEEQLVECVKYVDTVLDGTTGTRPSYLSDEDFETIYEARRMVYTHHDKMIATIPANCNDAEVAKNFLKFIASDTGALMHSDSYDGMVSIFNSNVKSEANLSNFSASVNYALNTDPLRVCCLTSPYVVYGGLNFFRYYSFCQELYKTTDPAATVKAIVDWTENDLNTTWSRVVNSYQP